MNIYTRHRFPPDIISYAVRLYYRFKFSHRDIEDLLAERGITVSYETIRLWCIKFGAKYATRMQPIPSDRFSHVTARRKENNLTQLTEESIHELVIFAKDL